MKPWHWYFLEPSGSIRVGVLFEGDTNPQGWTDHGLAGNGYPAPSAYRYALLVKSGANGSWSSEWTIKNKNEESQMIFGINDEKLGDNTGAFTVKVTEIAPLYSCSQYNCPSLDDHRGWIPWIMTGGASTKPPDSSSPSPSKPCEGKTSDGLLADFLFDVYCGSMKSSPIPAQGCTRPDALKLAKKLVGYGCYINETEGPPQGSGCTGGGGEKQFKFCVTCYNSSGPIYNTLSDTACTEDQAKQRILNNLPSTTSSCSATIWKGSCP